ncbi:MAG: 30S ribosomal protein S12 methylthiotransferase RimO, partial [Thermodesulfatator sp.]
MKKIASPESKKSPSRPDTACPNRARVFVVSLGCPKNLIDTEYALGSLGARAGGLEFCKDQDQADIILV